MTASMDRQIGRSPWRRGGVVIAGVIIIAGIAAALLAAIATPSQRSLRVDARTLTIDTVVQGVFHDFTPLQAKIEPNDTLYLDALEGGQVQAVLVRAGDQVAAGQPLLRFHNSQVELDVQNREAIASQSLTQAQAYQTQLEANHAANERSLQQIDYDIVRLKRALERRAAYEGTGVFTQEQIDQIRDEYDFAVKQRPVQAAANVSQETIRQAQLPIISDEIARMQQSLVRIRARLDDLTVKAPMTGRLTVMDLKLGQSLKPGDRLGELAPDTGFKVVASIDEFYLGRIRPGEIAETRVENKPARLKVSRIYPQVSNGVFTIDLAFDGSQPTNLTPGEAIQGRLSLGGDKPALTLAAGAFLDRSGGDYVFVLAADGGHAERRRIKLGRRNGDSVEVLEGLAPGARVITSNYEGFEKVDWINFK